MLEFVFLIFNTYINLHGNGFFFVLNSIQTLLYNQWRRNRNQSFSNRLQIGLITEEIKYLFYDTDVYRIDIFMSLLWHTTE